MEPTKEQLTEWANNSKYWKYGIFYYNKEDKRVFPPKRLAGLGWTINFANNKSIIAMLLIMLFGWIMTYLLIHYSS